VCPYTCGMPWHAQLDLTYRQQGDTTVLQHAHSGPLRVFKSLYPEGPHTCHNVVVHPPGGLVAGDHLQINVQLETGAHALVSTPGATRFYKSSGEPASQDVVLRLAPGARLEWLPLETLAYNACQAHNRLFFDLAPGAELMAWDVVGLGLPAAGLPFQTGVYHQRMDWPGVWLDQGVINAQDTQLLDAPAGLAGHRSMGTWVWVTGSPMDRHRREQVLEALRTVVAQDPLSRTAGVTCPNDHVLVARALAPQVEPVMALWQKLWRAWRAEAWGLGNTPPRIWAV
jgi:urease accessory protein